jgi:hypothetical protein
VTGTLALIVSTRAQMPQIQADCLVHQIY